MQSVTFKFWPVAIMIWLPALAHAGDGGDSAGNQSADGASSNDKGERTYTWVDEGHTYATNQAQALTEWMDGFFHDPAYEFEQPESRLRIEWSTSWDEIEDDRTRIRLRGRLQLPALSRRVGIIFGGEDSSEPGIEEDELEDEVGLQYVVGEHLGSRLDATVSVSSSDVTPGVRYRYQDFFTDNASYRFRQRLEYNHNEKLHATSRLDFDYRLADDELIRWSNRAMYGEETDGTEWRSRLSLRHRLSKEGSAQPFVLRYFGTVRGITDPKLTKSYALGIQVRRQIFRKFLFAELEPTYSWRKKNTDVSREGAWKLVLRFEIALQKDLARKKPSAGE